MTFIDGLVNYIVQIASWLLYGIAYIPSWIIKIFMSVLYTIWATLAGFISAFTGFSYAVFNFVIGMFTLFLPSLIVAMLGFMFLIVIALRIYSIVKDFSFAGFKV